VVVSLLFVSILSHGGFKVVCERHARQRAILPTLVTLLMGWWGLGIVWTPMVLQDNATHFGLVAGRETIEEVDREKRLGWRTSLPAIGFVAGMVVGLFEAVVLVDVLVR
jgi:hypothetical protein